MDPATPVVRLAVLPLDPDGRISAFPRGAAELLGFPSSTAMGTPLGELIVPQRLQGSEGLAALFEACAETGEAHGTRSIRRADGSEFLGELVITALPGGGYTAVVSPVVPSADAPALEDRRQSEWFHRALIARSPVVKLVFDPDGQWRWSSPAAIRLLGPGRPMPDVVAALVHPEDLERVRSLFATALTAPTAEPEAVEVRLRPPGEDDWRVFALTVQNLVDEPAVEGVVIYAIDVTRAVDAERREQLHSARIETLISALRVGILVEDTDRRAVLANEALPRLVGSDVSADELIGRHTSDLLPPDELFADPVAARAESLKLLAQGKPATGAEFALTNGRVVVRDYAPIHADGSVAGHLWVLRDVTDQATIRRGLEERNRALAEVATLKTEFVAAASHELRTPLTSIATFSQMLCEEPDSPADQRQIALDAIARNADRTLKIVDDLLTLAGLEAGTLPLTLRAVHLPDVVGEAVDAFGGAAVRAGVTVEMSANVTGPMLRVDPPRLRQAVDALLSIVATAHAGSRIDVRVTFAAAQWTIRVGAPSALAEGDHLFTTGDRGAGNALSFLISRAIVSRHGGQLATPRTGQTDAFAITLPVRPHLADGDAL
ncbi:PAS domain-containing sensor histidine kinase [Cryptosporangium phraense]|uniref:histidine kinase n=1 Tax=Cryptosporangium phraense TaxID=2593070 RepID=A0A545AGR3_9ACTN|nr:PAS domain-containing sensor histidine kinase [Cryptosporangium phraense]TQS40507.1 PAS domain-containing sensor histidine kinase [Cryptosporangium phraense]